MVHIVGWGHTPFGKLDALTLEDMIRDAGSEALAHAGVAAKDVDGIWVGHFNGGMVPDGFPASMALSIDPALPFKPATRLENACASGSAAVFAARNAILAGEAKIALDLSSLTKSVKGSQVIEIVLDQLDLGWLAEDGALVIDTTEHAEEWFATLSGRFARHHPNGQLAVSGYYRNGKEVGEWSWWYEDGTQQLRLSYDDDGENHGVATSWDKQGHLRWEREYVHGVPTGSWKEYWPGGTKAELTFLDGRPDGLHRWWHEGGALLIELRFDRGELQGPIEFHDVDGRNLEDAIDAGEEADEAERARLFAMRGLLRSVRNCYESAPDSTGAEELADKVRDLLDAVADLKE